MDLVSFIFFNVYLSAFCCGFRFCEIFAVFLVFGVIFIWRLFNMSRKCQVCEKSEYNNPAVTFHCIPANPEKRNIWFALLGFEKAKVLPKRPFICSDHFLKDDFQYKANGFKYLKSDARPQPVQSQVFQSSSSSDCASDLGVADFPTTAPRTGSDDSISIESSDKSPISDSCKQQVEAGSDGITCDKDSSITATASEADEEILKLVEQIFMKVSGFEKI